MPRPPPAMRLRGAGRRAAPLLRRGPARATTAVPRAMPMLGRRDIGEPAIGDGRCQSVSRAGVAAHAHGQRCQLGDCLALVGNLGRGRRRGSVHLQFLVGERRASAAGLFVTCADRPHGAATRRGYGGWRGGTGRKNPACLFNGLREPGGKFVPGDNRADHPGDQSFQWVAGTGRTGRRNEPTVRDRAGPA